MYSDSIIERAAKAFVGAGGFYQRGKSVDECALEGMRAALATLPKLEVDEGMAFKLRAWVANRTQHCLTTWECQDVLTELLTPPPEVPEPTQDEIAAYIAMRLRKTGTRRTEIEAVNDISIVRLMDLQTQGKRA